MLNEIGQNVDETFDRLVEQHRMEILQELKIVDSLPEDQYDDLVKLATLITHSPISFIAFMDSERNWFKAKMGTEVSEVPRNLSFCAHIIKSGHSAVIRDASTDPRFHENPLVTESPNLRFYAGFPIVSREGYVMGTICVVDLVPRTLSDSEVHAMETLARQVSLMLELKRKGEELNQMEQTLRESVDQAFAIGGNLKDVVWLKDAETDKTLYVNTAYESVFEKPIENAIQEESLFADSIHPSDRDRVRDTRKNTHEGWFEEIYRIQTPTGETKWVLDRSFPIKDKFGRVVKIAGICADVTPKSEN